MSESKNELNPPAPRLMPGQLLPDDWEVDRLMGSDDCKNIYRVRKDQEFACMVEMDESIQVMGEIPVAVGHLFPLFRGSFRYKSRTYAIFAMPAGQSFTSGEWVAWEPEITNWLVRFAEALDFLDQHDLDLSFCRPSDLYLKNGQITFLIPPSVRKGENNRAKLFRRITNHVLFHRLIPKVTRNLTDPLSCLHFSRETQLILADILDETSEPWRGLAALREFDEKSPAQWDVSAATDTGQVRESNEDACGWMRTWIDTDAGQMEGTLLAVSDGMGGHMLGEVASREVLRRWLAAMMNRLMLGAGSWSNPAVMAHFGDVLDDLAEEIFTLEEFREIHEFPEHLHPGATLVGCLLVDRMVFLGHCGDSRGYLLTDQGLVRLTKDHSLVQLYIDRGQLTEEEAFNHVNGNVITSFMGIVPKAFKRDVSVRRLLPGARLLLASDGLFDMLRDEEIAGLLGRAKNADEAVKRLVEASNRAGGEDNISVVVAFDRSGDAPKGAWLYSGAEQNQEETIDLNDPAVIEQQSQNTKRDRENAAEKEESVS